jgi:hypothetical protein
MTPGLPPLITAKELPAPELQAALLDGELFRIGEAFASVDEIETPTHRAMAAHEGLSARLIAERLTAAWIWGALDTPPIPHEFCLAQGARVNTVGVPGVTVREVVVVASDLVVVGGVQVTVPLRTVVDLARFAPEFGEREVGVVCRLLADHGLTKADALAQMNSRRNLPGKRRATDRLALLDQPELTR